LPFGLGGNSFYISKENMLKAGSWDPFNVTEDVDLSVRLVRNGIKLCIFESYTDENCPETAGNWLNQRTRWNKGLFITQLVHLRKSFLKEGFSLKGWFSFWLRMVCGTMLPFFNIYISLYILFSYSLFKFTYVFSISLWGLLCINILISLIINAMNYKKLGISQSFFITFFDVIRYLFLQIIAGYRAFWEYFIAPLKWNKTLHQ
jgi:cellulose synthase/poly-beta-1,6-N-acetylglucosamine synthase-like glycosyltransferase